MALNVRAKYMRKKNKALITSGELTRTHILEFFEGCNALSK